MRERGGGEGERQRHTRKATEGSWDGGDVNHHVADVCFLVLLCGHLVGELLCILGDNVYYFELIYHRKWLFIMMIDLHSSVNFSLYVIFVMQYHNSNWLSEISI